MIDDDKVCLTNINRQIIATRKTVGKYKVDVMKERILEINPNAVVNTHKCFYLPENKDEFDFSKYSYVVDAERFQTLEALGAEIIKFTEEPAVIKKYLSISLGYAIFQILPFLKQLTFLLDDI